MAELTQEQAQMLCESFEINDYMRDQEEIDCMIANNPGLHMAYRTLFYIANPPDPMIGN